MFSSWKTAVVIVTWAVVVAIVALAQDPSYDHQTTTYHATHKPVTVHNAQLKVSAFFSPDHSVDTLTNLVQSAKTSIDIGTPSWGSWSGCTPFGGSGGCSFEFQRDKESFPLFAALLNALHRGVKVRILTNNLDEWPGTGFVYPLSFLAEAGADVRYYTTTTFYHAKYIMVDAEEAAISSVNFSWTSFMHNREAGLVIGGAGAGPLLTFLLDMFDADWAQTGEWPLQKYNASDVAVAHDTASVKVVIPPPVDISGAYVSSVTTVADTFDEMTVFVGPDDAFNTITAALNASRSSVSVFIYQVTGGGFCEILAGLASSGVTVTMLVSDHIVSSSDYTAAQACYTTIYNAGGTIYKTDSNMYSYSHQKYVIVDGSVLVMSTGNFGTSDFPDASVFPPYGQSGWIKTNRDINVRTTHPKLISAFQKVMDEDQQRGWQWSPSFDDAPSSD